MFAVGLTLVSILALVVFLLVVVNTDDANDAQEQAKPVVKVDTPAAVAGSLRHASTTRAPAIAKPRAIPKPAPPREFVVGKDGFIRHWLILAPIQAEKENNGERELNRQQVKDEKKLAPREGDKIHIRGKDLTWRRHEASDYFIDFKKYATKHKGRTNDAIAYAVCYVIAPRDFKDLHVKMGSNDQAKVYVNGKRIVQHDKSRTLAKDQQSGGVRIKKGINVIVFKVINEKNNWQGCLRLTQPNGKPVEGLKYALSAR